MTDALYESDFVEWTAETAKALRDRRVGDVDLDRIAEEIEDLGRSESREVNSAIKTILLHLLKLEYQPEKATKSWTTTISRERGHLELLFDDSPSLRNKGREKLELTYRVARSGARQETALPLEMFPEECPYTYEQILDDEYLPGQAI